MPIVKKRASLQPPADCRWPLPKSDVIVNVDGLIQHQTLNQQPIWADKEKADLQERGLIFLLTLAGKLLKERAW